MEYKDAPLKKHAPRCKSLWFSLISSFIFTVTKLNKIKPGQHGYNVYVKVLESEISIAKKQDETDLKIAQAKVGDETASINVRVVGGKILKKNSPFENFFVI